MSVATPAVSQVHPRTGLGGRASAPAARHTVYPASIKRFKSAVTAKSVWMLVNTLALYLGTWALMIWSLQGSYWVTLPLILFAGGLTVRFFIINHDCGHGSFFASRRANDIVGFWTGLLAVTPYRQWRHGHALHHAKCSKVEDRGVGYFWIATLAEYRAMTPLGRFGYRLYRNPFVLLTVGGVYLFLLEFRFSLGSDTRRMRNQVWLVNAVLAGITVAMGQWIGYGAFLSLAIPVIAVATTLGLWLFYLQHHYEGAYWADGDDWDYELAALEGSSYIKLPRVLEWFAGYINYHHIHHLAPRIPCYRLREAHAAIPEFTAVQPLTWRQILGSWRLRLVDEDHMAWSDFPKDDAG